MLKIVCAWCGELIGVKHYKDSEEDTCAISHSMCTTCKNKVLEDIKDFFLSADESLADELTRKETDHERKNNFG